MHKYSKDALHMPKMAKLIMKWSSGKIKKPEQADNVLLGFAVIAMCISFILIASIERAPNIPLPPGTKVSYAPLQPPKLVTLLAVFGDTNEFAKK